MFAALLLPTLLAFVAGQAAAWFYLRTGRFWLGAAATIALWCLFDWWAVARFVFAAAPEELRLAAALLQGVAALTIAALLFAQWRRRWSKAARQRTAHFTAGLTQFLRSDYAAARGTFSRLVRTDPWDTAAWIALGDVHRHDGRPARAARCYRRASAVDVGHVHADLLQLQHERLRAGQLASSA